MRLQIGCRKDVQAQRGAWPGLGWPDLIMHAWHGCCGGTAAHRACRFGCRDPIPCTPDQSGPSPAHTAVLTCWRAAAQDVGGSAAERQRLRPKASEGQGPWDHEIAPRQVAGGARRRSCRWIAAPGPKPLQACSKAVQRHELQGAQGRRRGAAQAQTRTPGPQHPVSMRAQRGFGHRPSTP